MAGTSVQVRVISNRLPGMGPLIQAAVSEAVKKTTLDVEAKAKGLAPVKTGTLRRSIVSQFPSPLTGIVGPSVLYGKFVEFGTRRMGARPYMRPAAAQASAGFVAAIRAALKGL